MFAKLSLDSSEYDKSLGEAKSGLSKMGDSIKTGLATAAKVGAAAVTAASGAVVALTKKAVDSYAEYEQLVGGVETLFKGSADLVQQYAANAYKTAGLSANEYMETVTSFSASLLQSLGGDTELAADVANRAITDMSDNANKMGTAMESIQNAYAGFAKQNYTMLDNLKLGYGGTKEEMERLIADASKMTAVQQKLNVTVREGDTSFANIINAISVVQESLGIMGTTAKEASETISGSIASMKSAWKNLITGVADDAQDFNRLMDNFVDSAEAAAKNLFPRIEEALKGAGKLVEGLAPVIANALPTLAQDVIPSLVKSAVEIINAFVDALGNEENIDALLNGALTIILTLINAISDNVDKLVDVAVRIVGTIAEFLTDPAVVKEIINSAIMLCDAIGDAILESIPTLGAIIEQVLFNLLLTIGEFEATKLIPAIEEYAKACWEAVTSALKSAISAVERGFEKVYEIAVKWVDRFLQIGKNIVMGIWNGILSAWDWLKEQWDKLWDNLLGGIRKLLGIHSPSKVFADIGKNMALGIGEGWDKTFGAVSDDINKSFDFGTMDYTVNTSGNTESPNYGNAEQTFNVEFTLRMDDGTVLQKFAQKLYPHMQDVGELKGGALA